MANLWTLAQVFRRSAREHPVPVNPRLNYHELKYQLRHAEVSAAFAAEQYDGIDFSYCVEDVVAELPDLRYLVTVGEEELWYDDRIFRFEDLVSSGEGRPYPEPLSAGDDSERRADDVPPVVAGCHV